MSWLELERRFKHLKATPSNINEHLDTLLRYAEQSLVVSELGTGLAESTTALILGAPLVVSYDLLRRQEVDDLMTIANFEGKTFEFYTKDSSLCSATPCDLLFIDTWHAYHQLKTELEINYRNVSKWIILHDTETFKDQGESWQDWEAAHPGQTLLGLQPAINEFLFEHPEWCIKEHFANNNGLTVLERR